MDERKLLRFTYSPGYGDMRGEFHQETLDRNKDGAWIILSRDRGSINDPVIAATYAVSDEAADAFERFLKENDVISLSERKDSGVFATDYSPWNCDIVLEDESVRFFGYKTYKIQQFREYSGQDTELIKEMKRRFKELRGEKIFEEIEKDRN